jgi:FKBP-type peptidyl-prolyl cis-trans isomerase FkpA
MTRLAPPRTMTDFSCARRFPLALAAALAVALPAVALAQAAAVTTPSGLVYTAVVEGKGPSPTATDTVKVHYRGTFPDGKEFDSSYSRNAPATFPLNRVIPCWTEAVQKMKVGGKAQLVCPPAIAYGERGAGNGAIPPNATLRFEVELLEINPR